MALNGQDIELHLAIPGGTLNDPQPDPNDSLGGPMASTTVEEVESTVTSAGDEHQFTDNTQTSTSHVGKWLLFVTGVAAMEALRIETHDTGTGKMTFEGEFLTAPQVGDVYRIFNTSSLFEPATAAQAAQGFTSYRLIFVENATGDTLENFRAYLQPLDRGRVTYRIAMSDDQFIGGAVDVLSDETEEPNLNDADFRQNQRQFWRTPRSFAQAAGSTPFDTSNNLNNNRRIPIWVERTVAPLSQGFEASAWLLILEAASATGGGAGPWRTGIVLTDEITGFTPSLVVSFDRTPRTAGGARMTVTLTDALSGAPIANESVTIELVAPSPGSLAGETGLVTDEAGQVSFVYHAPDDEAEVGTSVQIQASIGGDP